MCLGGVWPLKLYVPVLFLDNPSMPYWAHPLVGQQPVLLTLTNVVSPRSRLGVSALEDGVKPTKT